MRNSDKIQHKKKNLIVLKYLMLLVLLGLFTHYYLSHKEEFTNALKVFSPMCFIWMLLWAFCNNVINGMRFYLVVRKLNNSATMFKCIRLYVVGRLLGLMFPQSGNIYRAYRFKKEINLPYNKYVQVMSAYTWLTIVISLFIAWILLVVGQVELPIYGYDGRLFLFIFLIVFSVIPFIGKALIHRLNGKSSLNRKFVQRIENFFLSLDSLISSVSLLSQFLLLTVLTFIVSIIIFYLAFLNIGCSVNFFALGILVALLRVSSIINITPGNLGVMEFFIGFISQSLSLSMTDGVLVSIEIRLIIFISLSIMGVTGLLWKWFSRKSKITRN